MIIKSELSERRCSKTKFLVLKSSMMSKGTRFQGTRLDALSASIEAFRSSTDGRRSSEIVSLLFTNLKSPAQVSNVNPSD